MMRIGQATWLTMITHPTAACSAPARATWDTANCGGTYLSWQGQHFSNKDKQQCLCYPPTTD